jgi:hypothetical protein
VQPFGHARLLTNGGRVEKKYCCDPEKSSLFPENQDSFEDEDENKPGGREKSLV